MRPRATADRCTAALSGPSTPDGVTAADGSSATDPTGWQNRNLIVDQLA
jgi:hypothetical protein